MAEPWRSEEERKEYFEKQSEQESMKPRYVDANVLKERMEYYYSHTPSTSGEHYIYGLVLKDIDRIETAKVKEVKSATWLYNEEKDEHLCSQCNGDALCDISGIGYSCECLSHWCPHCGARMDEEG